MKILLNVILCQQVLLTLAIDIFELPNLIASRQLQLKLSSQVNKQNITPSHREYCFTLKILIIFAMTKLYL